MREGVTVRLMRVGALSLLMAWGLSAPAAEPATRTQTLRLRDLREPGTKGPIELRSTDASVTLPRPVPIRLDETLLRARLRLVLTLSPALPAGQAQIQVRVNEEVLGTVLARADAPGRPHTAELDLDPSYFTEYARLRLQLLAPPAVPTAGCAQPDSMAWASLSDQSTLELTTRPLALATDLALLPAPFFDPRDPSALRLPVVLPAQPGADLLRSAGVLASGFGALAGERGARFPVSSTLPDGHALVLATEQARPAGIDLPHVDRPTVQLMRHPSNAAALLLLVLGRDAAQLQTAAEALALGQLQLSGERAVIDAFERPPRRTADDSPRRLPLDSVVRLGDLVTDRAQLQTRGAAPATIHLPLRLPVDVAAWSGQGLGLDLRLRHAPLPQGASAELTLLFNQQAVDTFALPSGQQPGSEPAQADARSASALPFLDRGDRVERLQRRVPASQLGAVNALDLQFDMASNAGVVNPTRTGCASTPPPWHARLDPDSTLDLRGLIHHATLPDLTRFARGGFPFSRWADLAETALILPDAPQPTEIETALALLGQLGAHTGMAGTRLLLLPASRVQEAADRDLLVVASGTGPEPLAGWSRSLASQIDPAKAGPGRWAWLPSGFALTGPKVDSPPLPTRADAWANWQRHGAHGALFAFESPLQRGRSVVVLQASDVDSQAPLREALLNPEAVAQLQGDLVLVRDAPRAAQAASTDSEAGGASQTAPTTQVDAFRIGPTFEDHGGRRWQALRHALQTHPWLAVIASLVTALLAALALQSALRQRVRRAWGKDAA